MNLPENLREAISKELSGVSLHALSDARDELTQAYRSGVAGKRDPAMRSVSHRHAYITARMPATYAAVSRVLEEIPLQMPEVKIHSLLDLGAGPGTASWAAISELPDLQSITLIERDSDLISLGKRLAASSENTVLSSASWEPRDLGQDQPFVPHDLVILSYVIGELPQEKQRALLSLAWKAAGKALVIIEPGTPVGYRNILGARSFIIETDGHLIAPCPHQLKCPIEGTKTWCHFSQRVERSSEHRKSKGGILGYEDEKFSYVIGSKIEGKHYPARVVGHPLKRSGHVCLSLCTSQGIINETVSRKDGEAYRLAKKVEWGDSWDFLPEIYD